MKKTYFSICFLLFLMLIILSGCNKSEKTNNIIIVNKLSSGLNNSSINNLKNNIQNDSSSNNITNNATNNPTNNSVTNNNATTTQPPIEPVEKTLFEFSTTIKSKSSNRLNNIKITCSKLNGKTIANGEEFSFCKSTGKSTEDDGYKKADVIVGDDVIKALGGGNCQVSSTLYNAVLGIPNITVTERHPHGKKVDYVPEGKDAAIAHGNKDLKFVNNTGNSIKIYANADNGHVNIKIVSVT